MTNRPRRKSDAARRANQVIRGRTMLIMLLLITSLMTVVGAFLMTNVASFYTLPSVANWA